jgi:spermidine synthase
MNSRVLTVALFLFISGLCALIFQTAWLREFRLIFGATTPASAAVLAIFMGGLGLGNAVLGRRVDASKNPLRLYALFELGISAATVASPFLLVMVRSLYFSIGGQQTLGITGATIVRLLLSTLVIGVPTFLMGGTLPAAARAATAADDRVRGSIGWLYGLNTIGAVIGALASTFILLERLGNRETLWAAAAVNIANACLAWQLAKSWTSAVSQEEPPQVQKVRPAARRDERTADRKSDSKSRPARPDGAVGPSVLPESAAQQSPALIYVSAGLVGFAFLLMELVWYRMLGPILGGTTFTFGVILAVALAGIGIGGALYPLLYRGRAPLLRDFALTCGWEAFFIALPLALGDRLAILAAVLLDLAYFGFAGQVGAWVVVAAIVIFPAAVVSGLQFPLLIALLGSGSRDVGKQVGLATACNTAGAMAGSLAGGFGLLPLLTAPGAWKLVVILLALLSLVSLGASYRLDRQLARVAHPLAVVLLAAICLGFLGPTAVWRHSGIGAGRAVLPPPNRNALRGWANVTRQSIVWEAEGQEASVAISANRGVSFLVNGKSDGNAILDASTQIMFPMVGAIIHPEPKRALVIGLGTGESAGWLASLPTMQQVDVVELEPAIAEVAALCGPLNHHVLEHPKVRVIYNDGREVLQTSRQQFDLIASEPSNPYRAGVANLFTSEFYQSVRQRLAPGGFFLQWVQAYEIDAETLRMVLCTARDAFGHVEIWETKPDDLVLVCSADPLDYDLARLQSSLGKPEIREALRVGWRTETVEGVLAHYVANERYVAAVAEQRLGWINTDNQNVLEYSFARTVGRSVILGAALLRNEAVHYQMHRPSRIDKQIDWEIVEDRRLACYAALGESLSPASSYSGDRAIRAAALNEIALDQPAQNALATWNKQPKPPEDLAELTLLALAHAKVGDDQAATLIERLRPTCPCDAAALDLVLAFAQNRPEDGIRLFTSLCRRLREDATCQSRVLEAAFTRSVQFAQKDAKHAPAVFEGLSRPFAVMQYNLQRISVRWVMAQRLGDQAKLEALSEMEPYVPWEGELLRARAMFYEKTRNARAPRAARELTEYLRNEPQAFVIEPQAATSRDPPSPGSPAQRGQ